MKAYGQSKLANLLFTKELQRRMDVAALSMLSVAAHPGFNSTNLVNHVGSGFFLTRMLMSWLTRRAGHPEEGARVQLYTATEDDVQGGAYYVPNATGRPRTGTVNAIADDSAAATHLWELSEELTGLEFAVAP